jgi:hypothetical protein
MKQASTAQTHRNRTSFIIKEEIVPFAPAKFRILSNLAAVITIAQNVLLMFCTQIPSRLYDHLQSSDRNSSPPPFVDAPGFPSTGRSWFQFVSERSYSKHSGTADCEQIYLQSEDP